MLIFRLPLNLVVYTCIDILKKKGLVKQNNDSFALVYTPRCRVISHGSMLKVLQARGRLAGRAFSVPIQPTLVVFDFLLIFVLFTRYQRASPLWGSLAIMGTMRFFSIRDQGRSARVKINVPEMPTLVAFVGLTLPGKDSC
jgi:hypothetical protein